MTDRYAKLREALAAGPTPGPWRHDKTHGQVGDVQQHDGQSLCVVQERVEDKRGAERWKRRDRDAAYIAACDPDTIRSLLADAARYQFIKRHAPDRDMWSDESIDAALSSKEGEQA